MTLRTRLALIVCMFFLLGPLTNGAPAEKPSADPSKCTACGMKFQDKYANCAIYMKEGKHMKRFDDIGCMVKWRDGQCTSTQMELDYNLFVRDYKTGEEIPAQDAFYVVRTTVRTPMGYGIVAFKDEAAAKAFSANEEGSGVMDYETMVDSNFEDLLAK